MQKKGAVPSFCQRILSITAARRECQPPVSVHAWCLVLAGFELARWPVHHQSITKDVRQRKHRLTQRCHLQLTALLIVVT